MLVTRSLCVIPHTVLIFGTQLGRAGAHNQTEEKKSKLHAFVQICDKLMLMIEQSAINK